MTKDVTQPRRWWAVTLLLVVLVACTSDEDRPAAPSTISVTLTEVPTAEAVATSVPTETVAERDVEIMTDDDRPDRLRELTDNWNTNWNRYTIRYKEILSGGPPRDGIPSIDGPQFISPAADSIIDQFMGA